MIITFFIKFFLSLKEDFSSYARFCVSFNGVHHLFPFFFFFSPKFLKRSSSHEKQTLDQLF